MKLFLPTGTTQNAAVTTSAATITLAGKVNDVDGSVRIANVGTATIFVTLDGVVPTTSNAIPLQAGTVETFAMPTGALTIKHIAAATGSTIYVTPGRGF